MEVIFSIITAFVITFLAIPVLIRVADKNESFLEKPSARTYHKENIPTFGGIAIFCGLLFSIIFWVDVATYVKLQSYLSALLIVFFIGLVDDFVTLSPAKKVFGQLLAIVVVVYFSDLRITNMHGIFTIHQLSYVPSVLLTAFTMIVITNAFNLIDGLDGLAGSVGVFSSSIFGLLFWHTGQAEIAVMAWVLTGALLAFLYFNFYPARIFMGDTGSLVVGFLLSVLAIHLVETDVVYANYNFEGKGSVLAVLLLIVPLFDALRVFTLRILAGTSPFKPDMNHIHHNLAHLAYGDRRITVYMLFANVLLIAVVLLIREWGVNFILLTLLLLCMFLSYLPIWVKKKKDS
jgi:UDP-GlcNAc:undecaprenyl-phosphate/decaprenyl-phosphate GlcNAc-1-phosphate transferase